MIEGQPISAVIEKRRSCRSYATQPIEPEKLARLDAVLAGVAKEGPVFASDASRLRYVRILDDTSDSQGETRGVQVGTYGTISGARNYLIGIMPMAEKRMELFGYQFELIVLTATALGLGTCWLGGIFDREGVSASVPLSEGEFIPIISPLGYPSEKSSLADRMLRRAAGSDRRKPWGELFFSGSAEIPLTPGIAGVYRQPLEMVRLGPSASNKQPWRIVQTDDRHDFYLQRTRGYGLALYDIQRNDIGIAMCHFELTARELGLAGHWSDETALAADHRQRLPGDFEYMATWIHDR